MQGALRVVDAAQREGQLLNCAFFLAIRDLSFTAEAVRSLATLVKARRRRPLPAELLGHLGNIVAGLGDLTAVARARLRRPDPARSVLAMRAQAEQARNPDSRVTLGTRRDRFGLPVARVDWRPTASDRASIRASQKTVDTALRAAGLGHVEFMLGDEHPPTLLEGNFHGPDASLGVLGPRPKRPRKLLLLERAEAVPGRRARAGEDVGADDPPRPSVIVGGAARLAEAAAENLAAHAGWVHAHAPGMRRIDRGDLVLADSGLPADTFNVVCRARLDRPTSRARIEESIEHFRRAGRPFSWWVSPSDHPADLPDLLAAAGLERAETETAMSAALAAAPEAGAAAPELRIARVATASQLSDFARAIAGIASPPDPHVPRFYELGSAALLSSGCPLRLYVGYRGGAAVATAELTLAGGVAGLYSVATLPTSRRRGFASALIARLLRDAREEGFETAVLQAAPGAVGLYERAGFRSFGEIAEHKPPGPR